MIQREKWCSISTDTQAVNAPTSLPEACGNPFAVKNRFLEILTAVACSEGGDEGGLSFEI